MVRARSAGSRWSRRNGPPYTVLSTVIGHYLLQCHLCTAKQAASFESGWSLQVVIHSGESIVQMVSSRELHDPTQGLFWRTSRTRFGSPVN